MAGGFESLRGLSIIWNLQLLIPGNTQVLFHLVLKEQLGEGFVGGGLPPTLVGKMLLDFGMVSSPLAAAPFGAIYATVHGLLQRTEREDVLRITLLILVINYLSAACAAD
jgi:hypothetical protein